MSSAVPGAAPGASTVGDLGELGLVSAVVGLLPQHPPVLLGPGDDAAVVAAPDRRVVVTTDLLVEGAHFRRDWSSADDVGHKAAAANLADIAAMGAVPTAVVVGLAVPAGLATAWPLEMARGLAVECDEVGASVVGGDVVQAAEVVTIAITALGDLQGRAPVTRAGAREGDVVAVAGRLGWSAAGLSVLRRGFRSPRVLVEAHRRPTPPYAAGPEAARLGATAMVDVSDGLVLDIGHVARASGVGIELDSATFEVPAPLRDAAAALGTDPLLWVLGGGEDHALAATFPPSAELPDHWRVVGRVVAPQGRSSDDSEEQPSVLVDGEAWTGPAGHEHFGARR